MWVSFFQQVKIAGVLLIFFTVLTGFVYPVVVTAIAQLFFPFEANGSLIVLNDKKVGSQLIGQSFVGPHYFFGRPSHTLDFPYNAAQSGASNWGPSNPDFLAAIKQRLSTWQSLDPNNTAPIPVELLMGSGSGLDPHISPAAAFYQVPRVAKARNISETDLSALVAQHTQAKTFGVLGANHVNVLELNLALDAHSHGKTSP